MKRWHKPYPFNRILQWADEAAAYVTHDGLNYDPNNTTCVEKCNVQVLMETCEDHDIPITMIGTEYDSFCEVVNDGVSKHPVLYFINGDKRRQLAILKEALDDPEGYCEKNKNSLPKSIMSDGFHTLRGYLYGLETDCLLNDEAYEEMLDQEFDCFMEEDNQGLYLRARVMEELCVALHIPFDGLCREVATFDKGCLVSAKDVAREMVKLFVKRGTVIE